MLSGTRHIIATPPATCQFRSDLPHLCDTAELRTIRETCPQCVANRRTRRGCRLVLPGNRLDCIAAQDCISSAKLCTTRSTSPGSSMLARRQSSSAIGFTSCNSAGRSLRRQPDRGRAVGGTVIAPAGESVITGWDKGLYVEAPPAHRNLNGSKAKRTSLRINITINAPFWN